MRNNLHPFKLVSWRTVLFFVAAIILVTCSKKENENIRNRLIHSTSPYLREHADNPVNWFEWGDEAIQKAVKENKPLIISIGYASCHWCHVMEEETFMDTAVARIMNENFVSIKIDREERPDIDQVYIEASQLITGHAGWPLNAFALPDGRPFYAGTYFKNEQWKDLLGQIAKAYRDDYMNVQLQAEEVAKGIIVNDAVIKSTQKEETHLKTSAEIFSLWNSSFDYELGGLKGSPKFPMPVVWEFLLEESYFSKKDTPRLVSSQAENPNTALTAVTTTLDAMARGGIFDQLGGGFARYSTDAFWKVPHFEKMLYDNAQLVSLYSHAFKLTKNEQYARVIRNTLDFVKKEMTSPEGAFYSSINADSEGEEGTFYVWTKQEIEKILGEPSAKMVCDYFNVTADGNWEDGKNVLFTINSIEELSRNHNLDVSEATRIIKQSISKLKEARSKRVHPSLDDKVLTSWNALMLTGYVDAYWALGDGDYLNAALTNARFLKEKMMDKNGHLFRNYSNGKFSIEGFLDDYALLARAFIDLYQATFDIHWLNDAKKLTGYALQHFHDPASGFFFYTSDQSQKLIVRKMEMTDQVIPSSNAVMAEVLFKLGTFFSDETWSKTSVTMLQNFQTKNFKNGTYYARWASVMTLAGRGPYEVAIVGERAQEKSKILMSNFIPDVLLLGGKEENLPLLKNKLISGKTIIYVCRDKVCKLPVFEVGEALKQLSFK